MVGVSIMIIIMVVVVRETVIVISLFVVMAASLAGSGFTLEQPPAIIVVFVADVVAIVVKVDVDSGTAPNTILVLTAVQGVIPIITGQIVFSEAALEFVVA